MPEPEPEPELAESESFEPRFVPARAISHDSLSSQNKLNTRRGRGSEA